MGWDTTDISCISKAEDKSTHHAEAESVIILLSQWSTSFLLNISEMDWCHIQVIHLKGF